MAETSTTSLKLDNGIKSRLEALAKSRQRTPHWLMRQAVEQYIEREERRQRAVAEIMQSYAEYQATGEYVSASDADVWLDQLEAGTVTEPPMAVSPSQ